MGYLVDKKNKSEGIRAIIHPSDKFVEDMTAKFPDAANRETEILKHMQEILDKVNKDLLPYKRITKLTIADEPLEMTSTKKIKRHVVAQVYQDR